MEPHAPPLIATIVLGIGLAFVFGTIANRLRVSPLVGPPPEETERWLGESVAELLRVAHEVDVSVFLELHPQTPIPTVDALDRFMARLDDPRLEVAYDVANAEFVSEDHAEALRRLAPRLGQVHLSDATATRWAHDRVGSGTVDFDTVFQALDEIAFGGACILEVVTPTPVSDIVASIEALAVGTQVLGDPRYAAAAARAAEHLLAHLRTPEGRLFRTARGSHAKLDAYLEVYAYLTNGLISLYEADFNPRWIAEAEKLVGVMLDRFWDSAEGGFFFTADDHERLIHRPKPLADEAIPSGNAVAAGALLDLGHLLGESRYLDAADAALRAAWVGLERYPHAHGTFLHVLERTLTPPELVVLRGPPGELAAWLKIAQNGYRPGRLTFAIPADAADLPGLLAERRAARGAVAYVCTGTQCRAPITDKSELAKALAG